MSDVNPDRVRSAVVTLDKINEILDDRREQQILVGAIEICNQQLEGDETDA